MKGRDKRGFTLVEMVIVIAVIGILAAVLIPTFANVIGEANEEAAKIEGGKLRAAIIEEYGNFDVFCEMYIVNEEKFKSGEKLTVSHSEIAIGEMKIELYDTKDNIEVTNVGVNKLRYITSTGYIVTVKTEGDIEVERGVSLT